MSHYKFQEINARHSAWKYDRKYQNQRFVIRNTMISFPTRYNEFPDGRGALGFPLTYAREKDTNRRISILTWRKRHRIYQRCDCSGRREEIQRVMQRFNGKVSFHYDFIGKITDFSTRRPLTVRFLDSGGESLLKETAEQWEHSELSIVSDGHTKHLSLVQFTRTKTLKFKFATVECNCITLVELRIFPFCKSSVSREYVKNRLRWT